LLIASLSISLSFTWSVEIPFKEKTSAALFIRDPWLPEPRPDFIDDLKLLMALDGQVEFETRRREQCRHGQVVRAVFASSRIFVDDKGAGFSLVIAGQEASLLTFRSAQITFLHLELEHLHPRRGFDLAKF